MAATRSNGTAEAVALRDKAEAAAQQHGGQTPADLLRRALDKNADVEKLERFMALQERWERNEARKAFFAALTDLQAEAPIIEKDAVVDFTTRAGRTYYRHASLDHIANVMREPLRKHGFSYRYEMRDTEGGLIVSCIVTHVSGHSERTEMSAPADTSGSKNAIQARGSSVTYLQRYTLLCALGLVTADEDDDGRNGEKPPPAEPDAFASLLGVWISETAGPASPLCGYRPTPGEVQTMRQIIKDAHKGKAKPQTPEAALEWVRQHIRVEPVEDGDGMVTGVAFTHATSAGSKQANGELPL